MHLRVMVALLVIIPSRVQAPPLTQAHTSTIGEKMDEAPLESLATNTSASLVSSIKVQRKTYSTLSNVSKTELTGKPPSKLKVTLSPASTAVRM